jgi:hypothetical protein
MVKASYYRDLPDHHFHECGYEWMRRGNQFGRHGDGGTFNSRPANINEPSLVSLLFYVHLYLAHTLPIH